MRHDGSLNVIIATALVAALLPILRAHANILLSERTSFETPPPALQDDGCSKTLNPIVTTMNNGIDLTKVELNRLPPESIKRRVIDFTCTNASLPSAHGIIPDQIAKFAPMSQSKCGLSSFQFDSFASATLGLTEEFSANFLGLMAASESMSAAVGAIVEYGGVVGAAFCNISTYELALQFAWELQPSDELRKNIVHFVGSTASKDSSKCLPFDHKTFQNYSTLIDGFGTAFIQSGTVGGRAQLFYGVSNAFEDFITKDEVDVSAKASLFNAIAAAGGFSGHADINIHFNESLLFGESATIGGVGTPFNGEKSWSDWEKSVVEQAPPALIKQTTTDLSAIIGNWDKGCGKEYQKGVENYYRAAYLKFLLRTLSTMQAFYAKNPPSRYIQCALPPHNCTGLDEPPLINKTIADIKALMAISPITNKAEVVAFSAIVAALISEMPSPPKKELFGINTYCTLDWVDNDFGLQGHDRCYSKPAPFTHPEASVYIDPRLTKIVDYSEVHARDAVVSCTYDNCFYTDSGLVVAQTLTAEGTAKYCEAKPHFSSVNGTVQFKAAVSPKKLTKQATCPPCKSMKQNSC